MRDIDRYDIAFVLLDWLAGMAAIKLGVDVRIVLLVMPMGVAFPIFRHLGITPARVRRLEAERATRDTQIDHSHDAVEDSGTVVGVSSETAMRLKRIAARRGQQMDEALADLLREAEQRAA
jgi:hypothetical protein